ncbi:hypothetical protein AVEN_159954-1 [Araneus ventricosus]|uniref:Uncharacterized protein n=1 Tax=Araneus ventricosus TaxID=182803 RepID=A0A4Y2I1Q2_ARAVE|nr:hypothetical protein AVEN_159954-1 [Araneus ventricosus]
MRCLKRFTLHPTDKRVCGETGVPLHFTTSWPLTTSYHHKKPSPHYTAQWWRRSLPSKLARGRIHSLKKFQTTNEDLIKSHYPQDDTDSSIQPNNEISQSTHLHPESTNSSTRQDPHHNVNS